MSRLTLVALLVLAVAGPARAEPNPVVHDAMGPLVDVTNDWQRYQPADRFCIEMNGFDIYTALTGDTGEQCGQSGKFRLDVQTPPLCPGCRRLFIDYSQIPENDASAGLFWAHGHVFFRLHAWNFTYTADPIAHSPNIKNFTNDKLVAPYGSPQEQVITAFDTHSLAYVGSTDRFTHSEIQGPYYVGPAYKNRDDEVIHGAYVDVDVAGATDLMNPALNEIRYWAGFNSGEVTCPDNLFEEYDDGNYFYYGCASHPAVSESFVDPFATT